jgi:hypothetical protein
MVKGRRGFEARKRGLGRWETVLRFGYLGKWSPCGCGSLTTRGKYLTHYALYFMSNFTLTSVKRIKLSLEAKVTINSLCG